MHTLTVPFRAAVDIGGTFTDLVALAPDGRQVVAKVPSTPHDFSEGILDGLRRLFDQGVPPHAVELVLHGTTVATNAILEHKGARLGLVATRGFRDVLEFRRLRVPSLYNMAWDKPEPLVLRQHRLEVTERVDTRGTVLVALTREEARRVAREMKALGVEAVAVCLLNSYANPVNEALLGEVLAEELPATPISLSYTIQREIKEYERTSTTVVDAYIKPVVQRYLTSLSRRLQKAEVDAPLLIMQSSGNLMTAARAAQQPVYMIESGPAAGVIGGRTLARLTGRPNMIAFDMGGTTAKASIIEGGELSISPEYEVGGGLSVGSRLIKGAGYALRVPSIDLAEVGAGGGSIARVDRGGALHVGPVSAGAVPGPACYDLGGTEPTVTDANVVLGYLNPERLAGGTLRVKPELSVRAVQDRVAGPLGLDLDTAAWGVHVLACASMTRAIRAVSTERGRDARDYVLLAFGGSGPVHAAHMARTLGIGTVLVPPSPGLFSAVGMLFSDVGQQFVQTCLVRLAPEGLSELDRMLTELAANALAQLKAQGYETGTTRLDLELDLRYSGQMHFLTVRAPAERLGPEHVAELRETFGREHERTYGHRGTDEPVDVVNLRLTARSVGGRWDFPMLRPGPPRGDAAHPEERLAYFGPEYGRRPAALVDRASLARRGSAPGPLVLEEYDCTIVVPPDCSAEIDPWGSVVIQVQQEGAR